MSKYTQASGRCNPGNSSVSGTPLLPSCGGCRRARDPLRKPYCHNVRHRARIDAERAVLGPLPVQRTADFELGRVQVSVHSGFTVIVIGRRVGGRRWRRLGRNAELGIVAQQRVVVALLEVVCESVEKVEELSDGLGVEIVGQPVWAQRAGRVTHEGGPGACIRGAVRREHVAGGRD